MAIIKVEKQSKNDVNSSTTNVKKSNYNNGDSLNALNNLAESKDIGVNNDNYDVTSGMGAGNRIKNETGIVGACIGTSLGSFIATIVDLLVLGGIVFSLLYFTGWINGVKDFLLSIISKVGEEFIFYIIYSFLLLLSCLLIKGNIRGSIKRKFKYNYLSKLNIYIYDAFIAIWNIIFYIINILVFFWLVDNYQVVFDLLVKIKFMNTSDIVLKGYGYIKYVIVIVSSLFMTLNAIRCVSLIHRLNQFVFEDEI